MNSIQHCWTRVVASAAILGIFSLTACTSAQIQTLQPVGPKPAGVARTGPMLGYLKVYSDTDSFNDGDVMYYPHSDYSIYTRDGKKFKHVANHISNNDETPEVASVPVGSYYILAKSEVDGLVRVPVVIKGGQVTVVNLERSSRESDVDAHGVEASRGVKSASGHLVGWRAES